jgi:transmembrane sensor
MEDWELITKHLRGELSDNDKKAFEVWLKADVSNTLLFNEIKATWDSADIINKNIAINKAKAWESIQQKIALESEKIAPNPKKTSSKVWVFRAAAIFVVALFATWFLIKNNADNEFVSVQTQNNKQVVVLPDGSKVILNNNSTLTYPKKFNANERKVTLKGEAFFDVVKNPNQPYIIEHKDFNVKVLGTSFNVLAYESDTQAVVTVVSGKVMFDAKQGNSVTLSKDDVGVLNKSKKQIEKTINSNLNFLTWKTKKIEFKNTNFKDVCETLQKHFSVNFSVKNSAIFNCKFTGYFENPTLNDVMTVLEKTLNLKADINDKEVFVDGAGC